jgi:predicted alpha/beta hydrolase family esterase
MIVDTMLDRKISSLERRIDYLETKIREFEKTPSQKVVEMKVEEITSQDTWISQDQAMSLLQCRTTKLNELRRAGHIKIKKRDGRNVYSKESIDSFLQK